jgi:hypothetical protein
VEAEETVRNVLRERFRKEWLVLPFYLRSEEEAGELLRMWVWLCGSQETSSSLNTRFAKEPGEAAQFLAAYRRVAWSLETGLSHLGGIERDGYNAIAQAIDPAILLSYIKRDFGEQVGLGSEYEQRFENQGEAMANSFARMHYLVVA